MTNRKIYGIITYNKGVREIIIRYASDLHLEFSNYDMFFPYCGEDVLILAGDITTRNNVDWIKKQSDKFPNIILTFGNHEHYQSYIEGVERKTSEALDHCENVHILQNESVTLDGVAFHGTTLWTDFEKGNPMSYMACSDRYGGMNDFQIIRCDDGKSPFTPQRAHKEHNIAKLFLIDNVKEGDIVVTHHCPTFESVNEKYRDSKLNGGYASDLSELILDTKPGLWFHGHVHDSCDYMVGDTRVLCNPRGYVGQDVNVEFDEKANVEYES